MKVNAARYHGTSVLMEMAEFASFPKGTQRFIRRSLDVGLSRRDAVRRWARNAAEAQAIQAQYAAYRRLDEIRSLVRDYAATEPMIVLIAPLAELAGFDLAQGRLPSFAAYRFLYERLIGAWVRPWLPSAFCAAASLPHLSPRQRQDLLETVGEAATCTSWSRREPGFLPEWVQKVDAAIRV